MPELLSPEWEADARKEYNGPNVYSDNFNCSSFGRIPELNNNLRDYIEHMNSNPNVLHVGVGADNDTRGLCASGPFEIAAILEGLDKVDYRMTILDFNKKNLDMAVKRETIFYKLKDDPLRTDLWKQYLRDTKQNGNSMIISGNEILFANIPSLFRKKKESGEVRFVEGDIVTADLSSHDPFDLIHCMNILGHLFEENRNKIDYKTACQVADDAIFLALNNVAKNMKTGAVLIVDDEHHDNWVWDTWTKEKIEKMDKSRLVIEKEIEWTSKVSFLFLRKR